jgi:hypothetical protein
LRGPNTANEEGLGLIRSVSFNPFSAFFYIAGPTFVKLNGGVDELSKIDCARLQTIVSTIRGTAVGVCDEDAFMLWCNDRAALTRSEIAAHS